MLNHNYFEKELHLLWSELSSKRKTKTLEVLFLFCLFIFSTKLQVSLGYHELLYARSLSIQTQILHISGRKGVHLKQGGINDMRRVFFFFFFLSIICTNLKKRGVSITYYQLDEYWQVGRNEVSKLISTWLPFDAVDRLLSFWFYYFPSLACSSPI